MIPVLTVKFSPAISLESNAGLILYFHFGKMNYIKIKLTINFQPMFLIVILNQIKSNNNITYKVLIDKIDISLQTGPDGDGTSFLIQEEVVGTRICAVQ